MRIEGCEKPVVDKISSHYYHKKLYCRIKTELSVAITSSVYPRLAVVTVTVIILKIMVNILFALTHSRFYSEKGFCCRLLISAIITETRVLIAEICRSK